MSDQKQPNITIDRGSALKDVDISTHNNNNTVIYQGGSADEKRKEENRAYFKDFACRLIVKDIITDDIRQILDSRAFELNLNAIERDHIIEQVRLLASKNVEMSELHKISLREAKSDIQQNKNIEGAIISLKALADKFRNEEVDFFYNMTMAAKHPGDHIKQYLDRKTDSYWQTYWAYVSFMKMKRYEDAEKLIVKLGDYNNYHLSNVIPVLKNTGFLIKTSDHKALKSMIKDVPGNMISPELTMLNSILAYVADNGVTLTNSPYANFYLENFFNLKTVEAAKLVITPKVQVVKQSDTRYDKPGSGNGSNGNNGSTGVVTIVDEGKNKKLTDDVIKVVRQKGGKAGGNGGSSGGGGSAGSGSILKTILIGAACLIVGSFIVNKLKSSEEKAPAVQTVVEKPTSVKSNSVKPNVENTNAGKAKVENTNSVKPKAENTTAVKTEVQKVSEEKPVIQTPPPAKPSEMTVDEAYRMGKKLLAEGNYSNAASYLSSASGRGSTAAIYEMALLYKNGSGVTKDSATAFDYMLKAAESGYVKAFREVGEMYHGGRGTVKDRAQAEYWYRKAAAAGDVKAERLLNNM